jgi:23S rRNA pseudouridine2605 synthase
MPERLQKILARHGLGSRREIERWIEAGRVTVNRLPAKIGDVFQPGDRIAIDGKEVTARLAIEVEPKVLIYHKAQGQPISHDQRSARPPTDLADESADETPPADPEGEVEAVVDKLPSVRGARWVPINPMHGGDSGLLLLATDGTLGYALTRRKRWIPTAYMVRVLAPGNAEAPPEIPLTVTYDDEEIEFSKVEAAGGEGSNLWFRVELPRADRRAAVRALFESRELKVSRMTQVAFGSIELPRDLPRGRHRALRPDQIAALYALAQIESPKAAGTADASDSSHDKRGRKPPHAAKPNAPSSSKPRSLKSSSGRGAAGGRGGRKASLRGPAPDRRKSTKGRRPSRPKPPSA